MGVINIEADIVKSNVEGDENTLYRITWSE